MNTVRSITTPTLASVERAFAHWRAHGESRGHAPLPLRRQAIALLKQHRSFHVCRALDLHTDALKRWAREFSAETSSNNTVVAGDFVALPSAGDAEQAGESRSGETSGHTIIVERSDGLRLSITGAVSMTDLISAITDAGMPR